MIYVHATSDHDNLHHVRSASEADRRDQEIALLKEELRIKDTRVAKISPKNRPHYPPTERMAILELKAARGWNLAQTAMRAARAAWTSMMVSMTKPSTPPSRRPVICSP
jgi:hypothetical protein